MHDPITLKSGAVLQTAVAPFGDSNRLFKVILRELASVKFDLGNFDFSEVSGKDINTIKDAICQVVSSDAVEAAFMQCAGRCLYNGLKITPATFEPEETRPDYLPVAWEVIKVNLRPFLSGLSLSSKANGGPTAAAQK